MSLCEGMPEAMLRALSRLSAQKAPLLPCCCWTSRASDCPTELAHPARLHSTSADNLNEQHALALMPACHAPCCAMQCTKMTHSQTIQAAVSCSPACLSTPKSAQSPRLSAAGPSETSPALVLRTQPCGRPACGARERSLRRRCRASDPHRCPSTSMQGQGWLPVPWDGWCAGSCS